MSISSVVLRGFKAGTPSLLPTAGYGSAQPSVLGRNLRAPPADPLLYAYPPHPRKRWIVGPPDPTQTIPPWPDQGRRMQGVVRTAALAPPPEVFRGHCRRTPLPGVPDPNATFVIGPRRVLRARYDVNVDDRKGSVRRPRRVPRDPPPPEELLILWRRRHVWVLPPPADFYRGGAWRRHRLLTSDIIWPVAPPCPPPAARPDLPPAEHSRPTGAVTAGPSRPDARDQFHVRISECCVTQSLVIGPPAVGLTVDQFTGLPSVAEVVQIDFDNSSGLLVTDRGGGAAGVSLRSATGSLSGGVLVGAQTFGGVKTFQDGLITAAGSVDCGAAASAGAKLQLRRGAVASISPALADGEPFWDSNTNAFYVGQGGAAVAPAVAPTASIITVMRATFL